MPPRQICLAQRGHRNGRNAPQLNAFFVPEDETCFLLYGADSAELLGEAGRRAGLPWQRVQEAIIPPPRHRG